MSGRRRDAILPGLVSAVGPGILRGLGCTWRVRRLGLDPFVERKRGGTDRYIIALWHSTLLPLAYIHRGENATVLVSRHGDGELIVRVLERVGFRVARGSTTRGGAAAMREMVRVARESTGDLAITPDGPKGPAEVAQPGIGYVSALTGFPVLPLALVADKAWRLNSWDRFQIPKPRARIAVVAGQPIAVSRDSVSDLDPFLRQFESEMRTASEVARRELEQPW